jgi:acetyltransferase
VQQEIRSFIPSYGSVANPVDITAQAALSGGFERALALLAHSPRFPIVLAVSTLVREERFFETLPDLRRAVADSPAAVAYYSYTRASPRVIEALAELGIPCFSTPGRTARALGVAVEYAEFLARPDDVAALSSDQSSLEAWPRLSGPVSEAGARAYLTPLGIPSPEDRLTRTADQAAAAFEALGRQPVALKVQSRDVAHKSDVGGVRLGLRSAGEVRSAFRETISAVNTALPDARLEGVLVQRMAAQGIEAFVAARRERLLGPLVVVGLGGLDVESMADVAMRLAPVSLAEARAMLDELRGGTVLHGTRGRPASDVEALALAVVRVSELAAGLPPGIRGVEINPLLVLPQGEGVLMLDVAIEMEEGLDS